MSKDHCGGCGHHFPSEEEGLVKCPQCGRPVHLPDKVQCPGCSNLSARGTSFCAECSSALFKVCSQCEQRGPVDANFCANDGGKLIGHEDLATRKGAERAAAGRRRATRALLLVGASLVVTWFLCVAPVIGWFEREGVSMGDLVPTSAPQLSQAQIEATRQAEIATRAAAFEDIDVRIGEINDRWSEPDEWVNRDHALYASVSVQVSNSGNVSHSVLLSHQCVDNALNWSGEGPVRYESVALDPGQVVSFNASCKVAYGTNGHYTYNETPSTNVRVRVDELDGLSRADTFLATQEWDWILEVYDDSPYETYSSER